jgi:hypothetical protein
MYDMGSAAVVFTRGEGSWLIVRQAKASGFRSRLGRQLPRTSRSSDGHGHRRPGKRAFEKRLPLNAPRPDILRLPAATIPHATHGCLRRCRSVDAGYFASIAARRIWRLTKLPVQFGQMPPNTVAAHSAQNVHSKLQMRVRFSSFRERNASAVRYPTQA